MHPRLFLWFATFVATTAMGQSSPGDDDGRRNRKPKIEGQRQLMVNEDESITISLWDLEVRDRDDWFYPLGFTLKLYPGDNYSFTNETVTPAPNFFGMLTVPVTVNDGEDDSDKFNLKIQVISVNDIPIINSQQTLSTDANQSITILLSHLTVSDPDDTYPDDFILIIPPSTSPNYAVAGNQVIPAPNFVGMLSVPIRVHDGTDPSEPYSLAIEVNPMNSPPVITGQFPLSTTEETAVQILFSHITVSDSDNTYPNGFTLKIHAGSDYTVSGNVVTPSSDFNGTLTVNIVVNDGISDSQVFPFQLGVGSLNDAPQLTDLEASVLNYQVGKGPSVITETASIRDADSDSLVRAEIGLRPESYQIGNDELQFLNTTVIKGTFDLQRGVLTLSGAAPLSAYEKAIRSVKYNFIATMDPTDLKKIYIVLNDGKLSSTPVERQLKVGDVTISLDIPTAFTPNGDLANDTWTIKPLKRSDELTKAVVRVYNRNGKLVFEGQGFEKEWDGRSNGELLPADTYFYTIDLDLQYSKTLFKGLITILR